jgi:peptidyl-prolyl cis-trans isomerase B (cyclophilin B)
VRYPPPPVRRLRPSTVLALALAVAACGGDSPPPSEPSGETHDASTTARATERGVASIQDAIARRRAAGEVDTARAGWRSGGVPLRPVASFDPARTVLWTLDTTEGRVVVRLWPDRAPEHVSSLVYLTLLGFHDGLPVYGATPDREVLGGCPVGDGRGSPGYAFGSGPESTDRHDRPGLLSAVSLGAGTDDSKFRLTLAADPALDERSTAYGEVVEGLDVLRRIAAAGGADGKPTRAVTVRRASITLR